MNKKDEMYKRIALHGNNLLAIFPDATIPTPTPLCKKLRQLELKATRYTEKLCNGGTRPDLSEAERKLEIIELQVKKILNIKDDNTFFINRDPRGYALKLSEEYSKDKKIYKDWGGYGILAPDFSEN